MNLVKQTLFFSKYWSLANTVFWQVLFISKPVFSKSLSLFIANLVHLQTCVVFLFQNKSCFQQFLCCNGMLNLYNNDILSDITWQHPKEQKSGMAGFYNVTVCTASPHASSQTQPCLQQLHFFFILMWKRGTERNIFNKTA